MSLINSPKFVLVFPLILALGCQNVTLTSLGDSLGEFIEDIQIGLQQTVATSNVPTNPSTSYIELGLFGAEMMTYPSKTIEFSNLIERIQNGLAFNPVINPLVNEQILWFQKNQAYLNRVLERAEPYLFHIVNSLEQRNMPLDLAFLPIVESAFDPFAYSSSRASGLWQITPTTADHLDLKLNWWVDERRDIIKGTNAALNYLEELYLRLDNDWLLALAGYNAGGTTIQNAVTRNNMPYDFWSIRPYIHEETQNYVPRLLALSIIFRYPDLFGIELPDIENTAYFYEFPSSTQIDIAILSSALDLEIEDVYLLNPGLNRWATEPNAEQTLLIPIEKEGIIEQILEESNLNAMIWDRYEIQLGDTLSELASQFGTTVEVIELANQTNNSLIIAGDQLLIPVPSQNFNAYALSADARRFENSNRFLSQTHVIHHVINGDTLYSISQRYAIRINEIASWNALNANDSLTIGQELIIITENIIAPTMAISLDRRVRYTVRSGDSLSVIANRFRVNVSDVVSLNQIALTDYLQPGQSLLIEVGILE